MSIKIEEKIQFVVFYLLNKDLGNFHSATLGLRQAIFIIHDIICLKLAQARNLMACFEGISICGVYLAVNQNNINFIHFIQSFYIYKISVYPKICHKALYYLSLCISR